MNYGGQLESTYDKIMKTLKSCTDEDQYATTRQWAKDTMVKQLMQGYISIPEVDDINEYINKLDELHSLEPFNVQ